MYQYENQCVSLAQAMEEDYPPAPPPVSLMASSSTSPVQEEETIPLPVVRALLGALRQPAALGDGPTIAQPARSRYARAVVHKV
jgi:hypothetical protein